MRLLQVSAVLAVALTPALVFTARAEDEDRRPENQVFREYKQDEAGVDVEEIRFKDVTYRVSEDPDTRKKVTKIALFLRPNENVVVFLSRQGVIVDIQKGQVKNSLDLLPANLQKAIKETNIDDEVFIVAAREWTGKLRKVTEDGLKILPALKVVKPGQTGKNTYDTKGDTVLINFKEIKKFVNLTVQQKQEQANQPGNNNNPNATDAVGKADLKPNDTIQIGFTRGQVTNVTPDKLFFKEWKGASWGDEIVKDRAQITEVAFAPLELRRNYPVNNNTGEVVVKEEKKREGRINLLKLSGTVFHDQKEFILVGAQLVFAAGPAGTNIEQTPAFKEEVPIPPIFGEEQWRKDRPLDQDDGQVTIFFDPAKNLISVRTREALPHIVAAFAATDRDLPSLGRVYAAAALNGDPELALMLVVRHAQLTGADQEKQQAVIVESLQKFGDKAAKAILDHLRVPDGSFTVPIPRDDGTVFHKEQKDQAVLWKKQELKLLSLLTGAASGERARLLFDTYEERQTDLGEAIVKVFQARTAEAIDGLLDVAVTAGGRPTNDEMKRADDAVNLMKQLGEPAFRELVQRVRANGNQGPVVAKQLEVAFTKGSSPLADLIFEAIKALVDTKRAERKQQLLARLDDAKAKTGAKDWEGGLKVVEDVLRQDRDLEEAKKLLYECLVRVAQGRLDQKKRGEAATLCRRVIDDGQRGRGAESMLAKMLVEAANEDLQGNCIRRDPDEASEVVKRCQKGEPLKIAAIKMNNEQWYPIRLSDKGDYGWIHRDAVDPAGDGLQCTVHGESMKPENIRATIEQIRKLAPERSADADLVDGELWIRDAKAKAEEGNYPAAYASYQKAREFVPNDPALGEAWKCWVFANMLYLLVFAGIVLIGLVVSIFVLRNRQKRVRVAEFKYYGKDRIRVEREIDGGAAPPEGDPAAAPADQPSDAAPPA